MKKRLFLICTIMLVIVLAFFAFVACNKSATYDTELVKNGDFSSFYDSKFTGWTTMTSQVTFSRVTDSENSVLCISNDAETFAYLKQAISVEKNAIYKVSVKIKVAGTLTASEEVGSAHVSFLENESIDFATYKTTDNNWVEATFYVRPKNTDTLTIELCLGDTDTTCKGSAYFDDVSVVRVRESDVPDGATITNIHKVRTVKNVDGAGLSFEIILVLLTVCLAVAAYIALRKLYARNDVFVNFDNTASNDKAAPLISGKKNESSNGEKFSVKALFKNTFVVLAGLLLLTFIVRLVLLLTTYGVGEETTMMLTYASTLKLQGIANFVEYYANIAYVAPGTLYILNIIGATGLGTTSASILLRFVNVLADMVTVALIYFYGKKYVGNRLSSLFASLYAALPITMYFGGMHFAFESVLVALLLAAVIMLVEKKYISTYLLMSLAIVLDVRAMLLVPIALTYMGYMYYRDTQSLKRFTLNRAKIVFGLVGMFVLVYILTLPVAIHQIAAGDAFFNFKYMANKFITSSSFVDNAFNLYAMVGMNGNLFANESVRYLNAAFIAVLEVFAAALYFKNRNRQEILLLVSFVFAMVAVFTLKTDWTYVFLAIVFAFVYAMVSGEKRVYLIASGYSLLGMLNIGQLMYKSGMLANKISTAIVDFESKDGFLIAFSVFTVLLTGYFVYVVYSITTNGKIVDIKGLDGTIKDNIKSLFKRKKAED